MIGAISRMLTFLFRRLEESLGDFGFPCGWGVERWRHYLSFLHAPESSSSVYNHVHQAICAVSPPLISE